MIPAFDPALVTIIRKRFSITQGEVRVEYGGQLIEQYGDKIELQGNVYNGQPDSVWMEVAEREAIARGLAAPACADEPTGAFEVGKTYATRSPVDADFLVSITILRRTAKTVRVVTGGKEKTLRIGASYDGAESVKPWGSYSMCPVITANAARSGAA